MKPPDIESKGPSSEPLAASSLEISAVKTATVVSGAAAPATCAPANLCTLADPGLVLGCSFNKVDQVMLLDGGLCAENILNPVQFCNHARNKSLFKRGCDAGGITFLDGLSKCGYKLLSVERFRLVHYAHVR